MKFASLLIAATLTASSLFAATETLKFTSKTAVTAATEAAVKAAAPGATVTLDKTTNTLTVTGAAEKDVAAIKTAATKAGLTAETAAATTTTTTTTTTTKVAEPAKK